jgi:uncharacterized protein YozE (UPF0346 family)
MRLSEIILDKLNETALFEMAFDRKEAMRKFQNLDYQIQRHLIKITAFKDGLNYQHHCSEINGWLDYLNDVKWNRTQRLRKDIIMKCLWEGPLGHGTDSVKEPIEKWTRTYNYAVPRNKLTYSQIYELLFRIYDEMSFDLSKGDVNTIQHYLEKNGYHCLYSSSNDSGDK